jgi:hypothetical protein
MTMTTGASAAADAARLAPDAAPNVALLRELWQHAGPAVAQRVGVTLNEVSGMLGAAETRVVFSGHFSCGKSAVINTLIGQPLLPSSRFPETGVPCMLRAGSSNQVVVVPSGPGDRPRLVPFSTEAIAGAVKLLGKDGAQRDSVLGIERLDITLAESAIPPATVWVDSPGINDTDAMTERAEAAATAADVLVWVVNSRQPVSETEQELLARHLASHGAASVVFIVNAFLEEDSPDGWAEFSAEDGPAIAARIMDFIDTGRTEKRFVFMSARAARKSPDRYGGPQVRAMLTSLTGGIAEGWRVAATRRYRARTRLGELDAWLAELIDAERTRLDGQRADSDSLAQATARFRSATRQRVSQVLARRRADATEAVAAAVLAARTSSADPGQLAALEGTLLRIWEWIAADAAVAAVEEARRYQQHAPDAATLAGRICATVTGDQIAIATGNGAGNKMGSKGGALAGAGAGLVVGSVVPVIGHVIGAGVGAAVGYASAKKSQKERLANAGAEIERAGTAAVDVLTGADAAGMITATIAAACGAVPGVVGGVSGAVPGVVGGVSGAVLTALRNAKAALAAYADELMS